MCWQHCKIICFSALSNKNRHNIFVQRLLFSPRSAGHHYLCCWRVSLQVVIINIKTFGLGKPQETRTDRHKYVPKLGALIIFIQWICWKQPTQPIIKLELPSYVIDMANQMSMYSCSRRHHQNTFYFCIKIDYYISLLQPVNKNTPRESICDRRIMVIYYRIVPDVFHHDLEWDTCMYSSLHYNAC